MLQTSLVEQLYTGIAEGLSLQALTELVRESALRLVTSGQATREEMRELLLALPGRVLDSDRQMVSQLIIPALNAVNRQAAPVPNLPVAPAPAVLPDPPPSPASLALSEMEAEEPTAVGYLSPADDPVHRMLEAVTGLGIIPDREERVGFSRMLEWARNDPAALRGLRRVIDACLPALD